MSPTYIQRTYALTDVDIKRVDRKGREVTAYAAVFADPAEVRDQHGHYWEEINRAAFNRTISHGIDRVRVYYNHGYDLTGRPNMLGAVPIATPLEIKPDGRGLITVSRYNDSELADHVLAAWAGGEIKGQSFSGRVFQDRDRGQLSGIPHVERMELGLKEFGPTPSPMYEGAGLVMIRSQGDLADFIRSMIHDEASALRAPEADRETPPGPLASADPAIGHSKDVQRARLALKRKRLSLGVNQNAETA